MKYILIILILSCSILTGCVGNQTTGPVRETRFLLNTLCTISIYELENQSNIKDVQSVKSCLIFDAFDLISHYEALFSISKEGSDVYRINHANGEETTVSQPTIDIIKQAHRFSEISDGMFDITIGRLTSLWKSTEILSEITAEIPDALETINYRKIELNESKSTVRLNDPNAWIDLGGIAKGYIADKVAGFFIENGVKTALIDLGGDIITIGLRSNEKSLISGSEASDTQNWKIAVREPFSSDAANNDSDFFGIISTGTASIVTSGIYERFFEAGGEIYHHIIDPVTGFPSNTDVISATVVAENALTGDVLATIIVLSGSKKAESLIKQVPGFIGALLILTDDSYIIFGDIDFIPS